MKRQVKKYLVILVFVLLQPFCFNAGVADTDKPLFVIISTQWCYACNLLKPTIEELKNQYASQIEFVYLDASNEEAVNSSRQLAQQYGLSEYFDTNRNVFPKVGILCPGAKSPEKIIVGANPKETYVQAINELSNQESACGLDGRPKIANESSERPLETDAGTGRPNIPSISDRPRQIINIDRPQEVKFWEVGEPIPYYAYFQYLILPECTGNSILCLNRAVQSVLMVDDAKTATAHEKNSKGLKIEKK